MRWNDLTEEQKYAYWSELMDDKNHTVILLMAYPYGWYARECDDINPRVLL